MIVSDLSLLDWKYRARRTGQSQIDYASAVTRYESRPYPGALWIAMTVGLIAAIAAALWS